MTARKTSPQSVIPHRFATLGTALWRQFADAYDLDPSSEEVLVAACNCADLVAVLDDLTRSRGPLDDEGRMAPWVTEARFQKGLLLKLTAQLERLSQQPTEASTGGRRNIGGARGSYAVRKG